MISYQGRNWSEKNITNNLYEREASTRQNQVQLYVCIQQIWYLFVFLSLYKLVNFLKSVIHVYIYTGISYRWYSEKRVKYHLIYLKESISRKIKCSWQAMFKSKCTSFFGLTQVHLAQAAGTWLQEAKLGLCFLDCYWLVRKECRRLVGNVSGDW